MFLRSLTACAAAAAVLASTPASAGFKPYPHQLYDVDQPGPRGSIAAWSYEPPARVRAIRTCAMVVSLDGHRLFAPAFSVVLVAGDEVLRLRFINEDRKSTVLPAYLRRERADDPETAVLTGSRRGKTPSKREVRMGSAIKVGEPFDMGLTWAEDGKVDVMVRTNGREEHILVPMRSQPTRIRVISSSGYWRLSPFIFGTMDEAEPDPDERDRLSPPGCPGAKAPEDLPGAVMDEAEEDGA